MPCIMLSKSRALFFISFTFSARKGKAMLHRLTLRYILSGHPFTATAPAAAIIGAASAEVA